MVRAFPTNEKGKILWDLKIKTDIVPLKSKLSVICISCATQITTFNLQRSPSWWKKPTRTPVSNKSEPYYASCTIGYCDLQNRYLPIKWFDFLNFAYTFISSICSPWTNCNTLMTPALLRKGKKRWTNIRIWNGTWRAKELQWGDGDYHHRGFHYNLKEFQPVAS